MSLFAEELQDTTIQWNAILLLEKSGRIDGWLPEEDLLQSENWVRAIQSIQEESIDGYVVLGR